METIITILLFVILGCVALYQQAVIKKLKCEKAIEDNKDTLIALQRQTIENQSATISNFKTILANGVNMKR